MSIDELRERNTIEIPNTKAVMGININGDYFLKY